MLGIKLAKIIFHKGGYYEYKGEKLRMSQFREKFKEELDDGSLLKDITSGVDVDSIGGLNSEETDSDESNFDESNFEETSTKKTLTL
jgi:hypothetical protein